MNGVTFSVANAIIGNSIRSLQEPNKYNFVKEIVARVVSIATPIFCAIDAAYHLAAGIVKSCFMAPVRILKFAGIKCFDPDNTSFACIFRHFRNAIGFTVGITPLSSALGIISPHALSSCLQFLADKPPPKKRQEPLAETKLSPRTSEQSTIESGDDQTSKYHIEDLKRELEECKQKSTSSKATQNAIELERDNALERLRTFNDKWPTEISFSSDKENLVSESDITTYAEKFSKRLKSLIIDHDGQGFKEQTWETLFSALHSATNLEVLTFTKKIKFNSYAQELLAANITPNLQHLTLSRWEKEHCCYKFHVPLKDKICKKLQKKCNNLQINFTSI